MERRLFSVWPALIILILMSVNSPGVKITLGKGMLGMEQKIEELSRCNYQLECQLRAHVQAGEEMKGKYREMEREHRDAMAKVKLLDLELAQTSMKLQSAEMKRAKEEGQNKVLTENTEDNMARIEALMRENDFLRSRCVEFEGKYQQVEADLRLCTGRLDKANKVILDQQDQLTKKQNDLNLMEKTVNRKNDHIAVLMKKDKELTDIHKAKRQEILADRLDNSTQPVPVEGRMEREWRESAQTALGQIEVLKKKIKRLEEDKSAVDKELKKAQEDNYYLVNRLKSLK